MAGASTCPLAGPAKHVYRAFRRRADAPCAAHVECYIRVTPPAPHTASVTFVSRSLRRTSRMLHLCHAPCAAHSQCYIGVTPPAPHTNN
eukprot:7393172-Pyramimonas_sp.AAC.2